MERGLVSVVAGAMRSPSFDGDFVAGAPIDYSFKELRSCAELATEEPQRGTRRKVLALTEASAQEAATFGEGVDLGASLTEPKQFLVASASAGTLLPLSATKSSTIRLGGGTSGTHVKKVIRQVTCAVKLNNNFIETISDLPQSLGFIMADPLRNCRWIDLSFNQLQQIDPALLQFQQLKALYLHGNQIKALPSVERLKKLPKLISLTLNGNPIECCAAYRTYVIGAVPTLRSLDHSMVTQEEVAGAAVWFKGHVKRFEARREQMAYQVGDE